MATVTAETKKCPKCGSSDFGETNGEPVTIGGWYGHRRFAWGRYAGVHVVRLTGLRCPECRHVEVVDPDFD